MNTLMKKFYSITLGFALVATSFAAVSSVTSPTQQAYAQCTSGQSQGNLDGYAVSAELGKIYMSTDAWNADSLTYLSVELWREQHGAQLSLGLHN